jgi:hypothetical protein
MSVSSTNADTDAFSKWFNSFINGLLMVPVATLEVMAIMFSVYYIPNIIYKTICSKSKPFSIPMLSYVCKQIEDFLKPPAEPRSPIVVIPTEG